MTKNTKTPDKAPESSSKARPSEELLSPDSSPDGPQNDAQSDLGPVEEETVSPRKEDQQEALRNVRENLFGNNPKISARERDAYILAVADRLETAAQFGPDPLTAVAEAVAALRKVAG